MNLLPKTEKELLKKGLKNRFLIVAMFLISAFFIAGFIMLIPSYVLTLEYFSKNDLENNFAKVNDENSIEKILNLSTEIDSKLKFFQFSINNNSSAIDSISKIVNSLPGGVLLNSISFSREQDYKEKRGTVILVSGTAYDRNSLVSFSNILKESNSFSSVDVPVSSLTKDRNLPFSMNIFIEN